MELRTLLSLQGSGPQKHLNLVPHSSSMDWMLSAECCARYRNRAAVAVRILRRNRTNRLLTDCKELTHEKPNEKPNEKLVNWTPRRANGVVPVQKPMGWSPGMCLCFHSSSKARKETDASAWRQAGTEHSHLLTGGSTFLSYSGLQLTRWGSPRLRRAICFTQCSDSNVHRIPKHLDRHTLNNVWSNILNYHFLDLLAFPALRLLVRLG